MVLKKSTQKNGFAFLLHIYHVPTNRHERTTKREPFGNCVFSGLDTLMDRFASS